MANVYVKNATIRITETFALLGVATDPTTITLKIKDPAGTISTYLYSLAQITRTSAGVYYKDIQLTSSGVWAYRWEGTGAVAAADEDWVDVSLSVF